MKQDIEKGKKRIPRNHFPVFDGEKKLIFEAVGQRAEGLLFFPLFFCCFVLFSMEKYNATQFVRAPTGTHDLVFKHTMCRVFLYGYVQEKP
jgi:hypothetical protein